MSVSKNRKVIPSQKPNFTSHKAHCTVCRHPRCNEIEAEFVSWKSPATIATEYKLRDRSALYRHAHAADLFSRRDRNLRVALGRLIERVDDVRATAGAIVQAVALYARINARGEFVEPDEQESFEDQFAKMNPDEIKAYGEGGPPASGGPRLKDKKGQQGSGGDENA